MGLKGLYECPCMRGGMGEEDSVDRNARGDVTTKAEIGVMWPQVEACPEPSEAEGTGSLGESLEECSLDDT